MTLAVAILAHRRLDRVAQLAQFLADAGLYVCVHIDKDCDVEAFAALKRRVSQYDNVIFADRIRCSWGRFSLVEAELEMCRAILAKWPDASHIQLISGDCLPINPLVELTNLLNANDDVDFIESVMVNENDWIVDGLGVERFTLRFPFSWKSQRRLFDFWVGVQRKLGLTRRPPEGLTPHVGSQWWCLTRETILKILHDSRKDEYDTYFASCWIPDESYFQTLARKHARKIESRSLVYSHFDHQGKPTTFYDDHADMLAAMDVFFARKVWPDATILYDRFISGARGGAIAAASSMQAQILRATTRRRRGREGLRMVGRFPNQWHEPQQATATSYQVLTGFASAFPKITDWLAAHDVPDVHGRLFAPERAQFASDVTVGPGGLSSSAAIRDRAPECFLRNLVWAHRNDFPTFSFEPRDSQEIATFLARDPNATVHVIEYGGLLDLAKRDITNIELLRADALQIIRRERKFIDALQGAKANATLHLWTLGEVLGNPAPALRKTLFSSGDKSARSPFVLPLMANIESAIAVAKRLKNVGVDIDLRKLDTGTDANSQNIPTVMNR